MAFEVLGRAAAGLTASADLSAAQFLVQKLTAADTVATETVQGIGTSLGILQNKPTSGQSAEVWVEGTSKCVAGAAYAFGVLLMSNTAGKMVLATATNHAIAIARQATSGADEIGTCELIRNGKQ